MPDLFKQQGVFSVFFKLRFIQLKFGHNFLDFVFIKLVVIFKQFIMEIPKFCLTTGSQRRHSGLDSKLVAANREMFKNNFDSLGVILNHLLEQRRKPRTVTSFKIAEVSDDNRVILKTFVGRLLG